MHFQKRTNGSGSGREIEKAGGYRIGKEHPAEEQDHVEEYKAEGGEHLSEQKGGGPDAHHQKIDQLRLLFFDDRAYDVADRVDAEHHDDDGIPDLKIVAGTVEVFIIRKRKILARIYVFGISHAARDRTVF